MDNFQEEILQAFSTLVDNDHAGLQRPSTILCNPTCLVTLVALPQFASGFGTCAYPCQAVCGASLLVRQTGTQHWPLGARWQAGAGLLGGADLGRSTRCPEVFVFFSLAKFVNSHDFLENLKQSAKFRI